jgi:hypothetical protein
MVISSSLLIISRSIFDGDEGMAQIHDKPAAHVGLTHSADEIGEKETKFEIPSLKGVTTN